MTITTAQKKDRDISAQKKDRDISAMLVTGGCGFIGSNFINIMVRRYPQIQFFNLDDLYYCASVDNVKVADQPNYHFIKGNVCDYNLIAYLLKTHQIDLIVHFAAQSHVDNSFLEPLKYSQDNVIGTHTLLEAVRQSAHHILFVHISTDEVYGESIEGDKKTENHMLSPTNPYAATKAAAEMLVNAYKHSFGLSAIITRSNNVYGPNQYPEKLIPKFIKLLQSGQRCTIHGDGSSLRSFIHVNDLVEAFDLIIHRGTVGEIYNIGSEEEYTVLQIAHRLIGAIYPDQPANRWLTFVPDRPFNDCRYFIDDNKVRALGYCSKMDLAQSLPALLQEETFCPQETFSPL